MIVVTQFIPPSLALLIMWISGLLAGLYLGVFRSMIDRIRAGLSAPLGEGSKAGKLLESILSEPNHNRPLHVEAALLSSLQLFLGFYYLCMIWNDNSPLKYAISFSLAFLSERLFSGAIPKLLASASNSQIHLTIGYPFVIIARLITWPFSSTLSKIESIFPSAGQNRDDGDSVDNEVADHIRTLAREGSNLDPEIAEIVGNTLEMGQLKVQDIMVSRKQVQILDTQDGLERNLEIARNCGHTRLPLCDGDLDHCLGIVHVKYAFRFLGEDRSPMSLQKITKAPARVSAGDSLPLALRKMMKWKVHMALVGDEFGGIDGVITLEDILEEVVGEIQDEFDSDQKDVQQLGEKCWKISGLTPLHELPKELNFADDDEVASFGGLITKECGKIPAPLEKFSLGNIEVTILEADDTRIGLAEVRLLEIQE